MSRFFFADIAKSSNLCADASWNINNLFIFRVAHSFQSLLKASFRAKRCQETKWISAKPPRMMNSVHKMLQNEWRIFFFVFYWIRTCANEPIASNKLLRRSLVDALSQFLIGCTKFCCDSLLCVYGMHISLAFPCKCVLMFVCVQFHPHRLEARLRRRSSKHFDLNLFVVTLNLVFLHQNCMIEMLKIL